MTSTNVIQIVLVAILILFSSYFSATETAFSSLNKTKIKAMAEKGNKRAVLVARLADSYDKLLSTILIGNNIVNISAASIGTVLFVDLCGADLGATLSTVVITVVVLIFGEITPKSIAKDFPERFALFSAPFIRLLGIVFFPLSAVFSGWKKLLGKLIRVEADNKMSHEELLLLVDEVQEEGSVDEKEGELLRNVITFTQQRAKDIMTHRGELEAVPSDCTKEELARVFAQSHYSRVLVYEEDIDHIVGVVHLKDFYTETGITEKPLSEIMTPTVYVAENERINSILSRLQKKKVHVAVVVDEYGGTCGIVTMEDILEELVGEIWDEHDEEYREIQQTGENTYFVDGGTRMSDFCAHFHIRVQTKSTTLCGWLMEQTGQIPQVGTEVDFPPLHIVVTGMENHRVTSATVTVQDSAEENEDKNAADRTE